MLPPPLLPALLAACLPPCQGWSPAAAGGGQEEPELLLPPINSSSRSLASLERDLRGQAEAGSPRREPPPAAAGQQPPQPPEEAPCNISVQRQMLSSLLVGWSRPLGIPCDLLLFSTNGDRRAFFSAAFHRVGPPLLIEHLGLAAVGAQQNLRLCVGCSWVRGRRVGRFRAAAAAASSSLSEPGQYWLQGEPLNFCCLDFSLEELKGEPGWRLNRKPIESTLVACFMTLVIIVWSVAALIWPVPIIAGFLPNGMEQRRSTAAAAGATAAGK
uniref:Uncharacterized protein n=1 Tax=Gopherus agassizii TaxID=38772 RepID=A0A452J7E7_9SAUR